MSRLSAHFSRPAAFIFILVFLFFTRAIPAWAEHYDIAYFWDTNLENVLDYKEKLESVFPPEISRKLIIVGRGSQFGVLYDQNGSAYHSAQLFVRQNVLLKEAGLHECYAVKDQGYFRLYNISYGVGPHLKALEKRYTKVYKVLEREVGKNLFIEQIDHDSYALLFLRRGDIRSTYKMAQKHARLLRRYHIRTTVIPENNDTIVYGESSHLNTSESEKTDSGQPAGQSEGSTAKDGDSSTENATVADAGQANSHMTKALQHTKKKEGPIPAIKPAADEKKIYFTAGRKVRPSFVAFKKNAQFDRYVQQFIKKERRRGRLAHDETTGWIVYDLLHNETLVTINADRVFQAASMIKPFLALAYFDQVKRGQLRYTRKSRRMMEAMIQHSSNRAANWIMRRIGGPAKSERILRTNYSYIFKKTEIREYIPHNGRTYRNTAIPSDYIRFLHALWNKKLPYTAEMRRLMALPGRDRIYDGTPIPQGTLIYDKTGTTAHLCGDMGILVPRDRRGHRHPYALVGIIQRQSRPSDYSTWMISRGNIIRKVSTLVYKEMKKHHNLL